MWLELRSIVEDISESDARAIVISSTSERFFTAGLDRMSPPRRFTDGSERYRELDEFRPGSRQTSIQAPPTYLKLPSCYFIPLPRPPTGYMRFARFSTRVSSGYSFSL